MVKPNQPANKQHLPYIDCLRAFACLAVIAQHSAIYTPFTFRTSRATNFLLALAGRGWLGVSLFLVISGLCLYLPLASKWEPSDVKLDIRRFFRRRVTRIIPPYYVALALFSLAILVPNAIHHRGLLAGFAGPLDIPLHLVMLHNLLPATFYSIDPPFWSLALECQLYLAFPLLVLAAAKGGIQVPLIITFVLSVATQFIVRHVLGHSQHWESIAVGYYCMPARLFEFTCGMCAAHLVRRPRAGQEKYALAVCTLLFIPIFLLTKNQVVPVPFRDQMTGVFYSALVVACSAVPGGVFRWKPVILLEKIGEASYSIYLYHQPIIMVFSATVLGITLTGLRIYIAFQVCRAVALVAVGWVAFLAVERRFIQKRA